MWVPKSEMTVTVDADGEVRMIETMTMELKPITPSTGFQPKPKED